MIKDANETIENKSLFMAYDQDGIYFAQGNLDYIGEKISVFVMDKLLNDFNRKGRIRLESKRNYEEVYSGELDRIEDHKIFMKGLKNISNELKSDIKVNCIQKMKILKIDKEKVTIDARMDNISSGGVGFTSDVEFEIGTVIEMVTTIPEIFFETYLKILRKEKGGNYYKYGCSFVDLSRPDESKVRKAVYRLQIEEHKKQIAKERAAANEINV